jgi:3-dehydroquinate synthase
MDYVEQSFSIRFDYRVYFTTGIFRLSNKSVGNFLSERVVPGSKQKILFIIDSGVINAHPELVNQIKTYFRTYDSVSLI